jgi:putative membrane protein
MSGRDLGVVAVAVVVVAVMLTALLGGVGARPQWGMMGPGMGPGAMGQWHGGRWGGWGPAFFGGLLWLLLAAGVALLVVAVLRRDGRAAPAPQADAPLETLKRRLAKGELSLDEYETLKRALS